MEIEIYHVDQAINGSKEALEAIIENIEGPVFNLSLRMLGRIEDAEDAKQDILIKVITSLSSYKGKSLFSTWVYKIAVNHLINEKNKDFVNHPLSFEIFGSDIDRYVASSVDQTNPAEKKIFSEELKLSCTNVLLQCLNPFDRLIFILGTMFDVDSRLGSEITGLSADNFRQRLSLSRKGMSTFFSEYCEHAGGKKCNCMNRVNYALSQHRIDPALPYSSSLIPERISTSKSAMENIDAATALYSNLLRHSSKQQAKEYLFNLLKTDDFSSLTK